MAAWSSPACSAEEAPLPPAPSPDAPKVAGCRIFPADNVWNRRVDGLPVHPDSEVHTLHEVKGTDFEVVDTSGLRNGS